MCPLGEGEEETDDISDYGHSSQFQILTHFGQGFEYC